MPETKATVQYSGEPKFFPSNNHRVLAQFEQVYGHPRLGDSKNVTSSKIVSISGAVIETQNTIYRPR